MLGLKNDLHDKQVNTHRSYNERSVLLNPLADTQAHGIVSCPDQASLYTNTHAARPTECCVLKFTGGDYSVCSISLPLILFCKDS